MNLGSLADVHRKSLQGAVLDLEHERLKRGAVAGSFLDCTHGIVAGDDEATVDAKLKRADEVRKFNGGFGGSKFAKQYEIIYGPKYINPVTRTRQKLVAETVLVEFDTSDKAVRVRRSLLRSDTNELETCEADLLTGTVR